MLFLSHASLGQIILLQNVQKEYLTLPLMAFSRFLALTNESLVIHFEFFLFIPENNVEMHSPWIYCTAKLVHAWSKKMYLFKASNICTECVCNAGY